MPFESFMKTALHLAIKGAGYVSPNPLVGAIVVKSGEIIGRGYHEKYGGPHAEVNAIKSANMSVEGADLYCTLEPCSHTGKTPPCTDLIIDSKIRKVIISCSDPNPDVNGQGIKKLTDNGIEVKVGVLEKECTELNKFFFKQIKTGLPYVTAKMAMTLNGKISKSSDEQTAITGNEVQKYVHLMRSHYDAVLIGTNTAIVDDPLLNVREVAGRNPVKVLLDTSLRSSLKLKLYDSAKDSKLIVATCSNDKSKLEKVLNTGAEVLIIRKSKSGNVDLSDLFKKLGKSGINSVLVEGGAKVYSSLLKEKLADEIIHFISAKVFESGYDLFENIEIKNQITLSDIKTEKLGNDIMISGKPDLY